MAVAKVTVQGTHTPAVGGPARGERRDVEVTDKVRGWVRAGAVTVVVGKLNRRARPLRRPIALRPAVPAPEPKGDSDDDVDPPASVVPGRNASRENWATYLRAKGIRFPDDRDAYEAGDKTAWASRDDLIIIDQQASGGR